VIDSAQVFDSNFYEEMADVAALWKIWTGMDTAPFSLPKFKTSRTRVEE
jgi:hypothetical protein